jgi:2-oxoisovalerate dehydrogenase E1 component
MREITFIEATREALAEEMTRDPSIFVVGEGIGARGGNFDTTVGLYEQFGPERLRDTPISERGFTALCTGAAAAGARPVVDAMFLDFVLDALGDLIHQTPKMQWMSQGRLKMPVVIRGCIGILGSAGAHHSGNHYPMLMHIPGYHVAMPTTAYDAKGLFKTAIRSDDPVFFLEHRGVIYQKGPVPEEEYLIPFGQASVRQEGRDCTVVAVAFMVNKTLQVCERLAKEGISVEVIDPRTLVPLDMDTILESVHKTGRLLIVDEDYPMCGVGAEIAAQVVDRAFDDLDAPIRRLNGLAVPAPSSPILEAAVIPNPDTIAAAIRDLLAE